MITYRKERKTVI